MSIKTIPDFHTPRVLLVETNPLLQQLTQSMLNLLGALTLHADQPEDALALFQKGCDLVLLDLAFRHTTGFELAQQMRASENNGKKIPIIGHATVADPEEVEPLCLQAGMDALSPKITHVQGMYELLTQWLAYPLVMPIHLVDVYVPPFLTGCQPPQA